MLGSALSRAPKHSSISVCSSHRWLFKARGPRRRGRHHRSSEPGATPEPSSYSDAVLGAAAVSGTGRSGATGRRFFNATERSDILSMVQPPAKPSSVPRRDRTMRSASVLCSAGARDKSHATWCLHVLRCVATGQLQAAAAVGGLARN
jgi:hypothetical protein